MTVAAAATMTAAQPHDLREGPSLRRDSPGPGSGGLRSSLEMIGRRKSRYALARPEVVIAILQPEDFYGFRQRVGRNLVAVAERVARALHDEGRRLHLRKMSGSQLLWFAGRVEGVTETQQAGDAAGGMEIVGDHAGDPSAHRLAADDQR